jgi:hypothetical protein
MPFLRWTYIGQRFLSHLTMVRETLYHLDDIDIGHIGIDTSIVHLVTRGYDNLRDCSTSQGMMFDEPS